MNAYLDVIMNALLVFPLMAVIFTLPYIIYNYRKYGSVFSMRILIVYSFFGQIRKSISGSSKWRRRKIHRVYLQKIGEWKTSAWAGIAKRPDRSSQAYHIDMGRTDEAQISDTGRSSSTWKRDFHTDQSVSFRGSEEDVWDMYLPYKTRKRWHAVWSDIHVIWAMLMSWCLQATGAGTHCIRYFKISQRLCETVSWYQFDALSKIYIWGCVPFIELGEKWGSVKYWRI